MSWTQAFSVLTDENLSYYEANSTASEKEDIQSLFTNRPLGLKEFPATTVCLTLSPGLEDAGPGIDKPEGLVRRIVSSALLLATYHQDVVVLRVYLDPAWESLSTELLAGGCEVILMDRPSPGPNPAGLWRYLALEESDRAVTFLGIHEVGLLEACLERIGALRGTGLKFWRSPMDRRRNYRPIHPNRFGCLGAFPTTDLLRAFAWFLQRVEEMADVEDPDSRLLPSPATERQASWERPDLDEFFLLSAIYPRAAFDGLLTLIEPDDQHSRWMMTDIEYATWANPSAEIHFVRSWVAPAPEDSMVPDSHLIAATLERLFHTNQYPEFFTSWQHGAEEHDHGECCGCGTSGSAGSEHSHT